MANIIDQSEPGMLSFIAASSYGVNEIIQLSDGRPAVVMGHAAIAIGDPVAVCLDCVIEIASDTAVTGTEGADAFLDTAATPTVVSSNPTTGFRLGVFHTTKSSGQLYAKVRLGVGAAIDALGLLSSAEVGLIDGASVTTGEITANKVVTVDANKDINGTSKIRDLAVSRSLIVGAVTLSETEAGQIDGITIGASAASKALILDASGLIDGRKPKGAAAFTTADVTNNNQTGEQTMLTFTLPANAGKAGGGFDFIAFGDLVAVNAADSCTLRLKVNSTVVCSVVLLAADIGPAIIDANWLIAVAGASGKLFTNGVITDVATAPTQDVGTIRNIDFTTTNTISITSQWSAANVGNQFTLKPAAIFYK